MSKEKQKGTAFETQIVEYLRESGWVHAERRALTGNNDKGDITGTGPLVWECKNHQKLSFSAWLEEAEIERDNAKANYGIVVAKRRGKGKPQDQYAMMKLSWLIKLLQEAGYINPLMKGQQ